MIHVRNSCVRQVRPIMKSRITNFSLSHDSSRLLHAQTPFKPLQSITCRSSHYRSLSFFHRTASMSLIGSVSIVSAIFLGISLGNCTVFAESPSNTNELTYMQQLTTYIKYYLWPIRAGFGYMSEAIWGDDSILLPPPTPDPYGKIPRTLVVDFNRTLVYVDWSRQRGFRTRKRPYVDEFLERAARAGYEIILFADEHWDRQAHIEDFNQRGIINHVLDRSATNFRNGRFVKDLNRLGRDLKRVVVVDKNWEATLFPENQVKISPFIDDIHDRELQKLAKFLEDISRYNVYDLRTKVEKFNADPKSNIFEIEKQLATESKEELKRQAGIDMTPEKSNSSWVDKLNSIIMSGKKKTIS